MVRQNLNPKPTKKVENALRRILRNRLAQYRFREARIEPGEDQDGDPVLFVDAYFDLSERPIDSVETMSSLSEARKVLIELGEDRFPHIRFHFDERQKVAESR